MEEVLLTTKIIMFAIIEAFVVASVVITVVAGLYQLIRDKARELRGQSRVPTSTEVQKA